MRVNAVLYFRVVDPEKAIIQVEYFLVAINQLAQTTLRSVLGQHDLDEMLSEREKLNENIQEIIDNRSDAWGIKVIKVIHAEGEYQASAKLLEAAKVISQNPQALQLRYLQTLSDISTNDNTNTIVFPFPVEMMRSLWRNDQSQQAKD